MSTTLELLRDHAAARDRFARVEVLRSLVVPGCEPYQAAEHAYERESAAEKTTWLRLKDHVTPADPAELAMFALHVRRVGEDVTLMEEREGRLWEAFDALYVACLAFSARELLP